MAGDGEGFTQLFYILICNFAFYCHFHSAVFISKMIKKKRYSHVLYWTVGEMMDS